MKKNIYIVCLIAGILLGNTAYGQTTVGSNIKANPGALLDLKQQAGNSTDATGGITGDKGMGLPRVALTDLSSLDPIVKNAEVIADPNLTLLHVGSIVFNTTDDLDLNLTPGLYAWNGSAWAALNVYSASFSLYTDKPNLAFSMKKYAATSIPSQTLGLHWSGTAMCKMEVIKANNGGVTNVRFYNDGVPIMTSGETSYEFTNPSGNATITIEVDEDLAFTDEEDQKTTLLRFTIIKGGTSTTKTQTVTLRQFLYFAKVMTQYPSYLLDGSEQYFVVRSNTTYKVSNTSNPNGVIQTFSTTTGGTSGNYTNQDIRFTMKNDLTLASQTAFFTIEPTITDQFTTFGASIVTSPGKTVAASNSYILKPNSSGILIPVSRANEDGTQRLGATEDFVPELIWTDAPSGVAPDGNIAQLSIAGKGPDGKLYVLPGSREGNSLVAIRSRRTNKILWSWHIWSTNYDPNGNYSSTADGEITTDGGSVFKYNNSVKTTVFMDRSLGAKGLTPTTADPIGLYYQWGRKDPFLQPAANSYNVNYCYDGVAAYNADGKYLIQGIPTGGDIYNLILVGNGDTNNINKTVEDPTTFLRTRGDYETGANNWYAGTNRALWRDDLWNDSAGNKTVYDPCPTGWRVPRSGVGSESPWYNPNVGNSTLSSDYGAVWDPSNETPSQTYGVTFANANYNLGYYPAGGFRGSAQGYIAGVQVETGFWSATAPSNKDDSPYSFRLTYYFADADKIVDPSSTLLYIIRGTLKFYASRTQAYNVRCVQE